MIVLALILGTFAVVVCLFTVVWVLRTTVPAKQVGQRKIDWLVNHELPELPEPYWDPSMGPPEGMSDKAVDADNPYYDPRWKMYLNDSGRNADDLDRYREAVAEIKLRR